MSNKPEEEAQRLKKAVNDAIVEALKLMRNALEGVPAPGSQDIPVKEDPRTYTEDRVRNTIVALIRAKTKYVPTPADVEALDAHVREFRALYVEPRLANPNTGNPTDIATSSPSPQTQTEAGTAPRLSNPGIVQDTRMASGPEKRARETETDPVADIAKSQNIGTDIVGEEPQPRTNAVGEQPPMVAEDPNHWWGPVRRRNNREGAWSGATRPTYPKVFRPFGNNTRERVVGQRAYTGMNHLGYATEIVESRPSPPLIPPSATLGQSGAPSVLRGVSALRHGGHHWLFGAA